MPYLSRIRINPARSAGNRMLGNPHAVHGMLSHGVPEPGGRSLWRWEPDDPRRPHLLVLTEREPDWSHVVEQAGWPAASGDHVAVADYGPVLAKVHPLGEFAFRLVANPVQSRRSPDKPTEQQRRRQGAGVTRGFRIAHRTPAHQLGWLLTRAETWGFTVPGATGQAPDVRIVSRRVVRFSKRRGAPPIVLTTVCFEGRLVVTDPARLRETLLRGAGPAKAYGCGLLTLAPVPQAVDTVTAPPLRGSSSEG